MAAKKQASQDEPQQEKAVDLAAVYNEHNHETAKAFPADKQCQCENCAAYRESL